MLKIYHILGSLDCPNWPKKVDESCLLALQSEVSSVSWTSIWCLKVRQRVFPSTSGRGNEWQGLRVAGVTSGRGYEWQGLRVAGVTSGRAFKICQYVSSWGTSHHAQFNTWNSQYVPCLSQAPIIAMFKSLLTPKK